MTIRSTAAAMVILLISGCSFLKRPPNQYFSLDTVPPAGPPAAIRGTPIGIDGIELPPGFDRRGIVLRGPDHKFEVRGTHQWASPLEEMVIHTLAFDLASRLPEGMVILPGQAKPVGAMRSLFINFEDLAPGAEGPFILDARWMIGELNRHERIEVALSSMESPAVAAAMSEALAKLADRIVQQLGGRPAA